MKKYVSVIWRVYPSNFTYANAGPVTYEGESTPIGPDEKYKSVSEVMKGYLERYSEGKKKFKTELEFVSAYGGTPTYNGTYNTLEESEKAMEDLEC